MNKNAGKTTEVDIHFFETHFCFFVIIIIFIKKNVIFRNAQTKTLNNNNLLNFSEISKKVIVFNQQKISQATMLRVNFVRLQKLFLNSINQNDQSYDAFTS